MRPTATPASTAGFNESFDEEVAYAMFNEAPPSQPQPLARPPVHNAAVQPPTVAPKKQTKAGGGGKAPRNNNNPLLPSRQPPYPATRPAVPAHLAPRQPTPVAAEPLEQNSVVFTYWKGRADADKHIKIESLEPRYPELVDHLPKMNGNELVGYMTGSIAVTVDVKRGKVYWRDIHRAYDISTVPATHLKSFYGDRPRMSCEVDQFTDMAAVLKDRLDGIMERAGHPGFANRKK